MRPANRTNLNHAMPLARTLAHRGPDAEELLRDGPVGLAFTRLSLVDPEGGGQPLISPDGSIVLIANGEVYNHRALAAGLPGGGKELRGGSDCEVLVHLYQEKGLSFLDDVRGMFGLVLWDRRRNVLVMARDHFGVKPLYFSRNRERVVFASEIKALFSDPDCPRQVAWDRALASPTFTASPALDTSAPTTWFEGVESVPAATIIEIDLADGTTREHLYWTAPDFMGDPACATRDDRDIIAEFRELLADSVRDCATADVSIGLFLSGGVDSAAVAALAADTASLETFTVLNGSTVANGDARFARRVADELGVPNHQILFEASHVPSAAEWKRLLWLTEMPTCGPEQYYKHELHRHARAHHPGIKGMLLGAAADEFCGGYSVQTSGDRGWEGFMEALGDMDRRGRLQSGRHALDIWWEGSEAGLLSEAALGLRHDGRGRDPYALFVAAKMRDVAQYNCWHEDRTAAGSGIEARVPFLDRRLFELVASIPPHRRERLLWDKAIVREAVAGLLPQDVVHRPKVPFFYGEGVQHTHRTFISMLTQDGCALLDEALESPRGKEFLNADRVRAVLCRLEQAPLSGEVERILPLINLCLLDRMAAESPSPPHRLGDGASPGARGVSRRRGERSRRRRRADDGGTALGRPQPPGPGRRRRPAAGHRRDLVRRRRRFPGVRPGPRGAVAGLSAWPRRYEHRAPDLRAGRHHPRDTLLPADGMPRPGAAGARDSRPRLSNAHRTVLTRCPPPNTRSRRSDCAAPTRPGQGGSDRSAS
ncbi:asparagine synthase (glutamine-hydrolyzing) [Streptomyces mirabilis]|uniref:asparagine synthase (glutamine-hydrolyzing) n=1 Tax=Streptomyces mirabilis TaxID=68239 RepID=UPI0033A600B7